LAIKDYRPDFVIRTDSSTYIGTGHVFRCLTLADSLHAKGAGVSFVCRDLPGNICGLIEKRGYLVYRLPSIKEVGEFDQQLVDYLKWLGVNWRTDAEQTKAVLHDNGLKADWLVVDHYALDKQWELSMRPHVKKIMVIDDLADRPHECDLLLDQNFYDGLSSRYEGLVPDYCVKLIGPRYALLRPEFAEAYRSLKERDGAVRRILVFFGGSDPTNETSKTLEALRVLSEKKIAVDVVVGAVNPHIEQIKQACQVMKYITLYQQTDNMAALMAQADLAIGGGGTVTWERCYLGLPAITIAVAANQVEVVSAVAKAGAILNLGWHDSVDSITIVNAIRDIIDNPGHVREMRKNAFRLMHGFSESEESKSLVLQAILGGEYAQA